MADVTWFVVRIYIYIYIYIYITSAFDGDVWFLLRVTCQAKCRVKCQAKC